MSKAPEICERLEAIDEEAMYQAPASTHAIVNEAAALIRRYHEAGSALAEEVKMNKAGLTQALTKREMANLTDALHQWNCAALPTMLKGNGDG